MELLENDANLLQVYRQSKKLLKGTNRAKNPDWYRRANELPLQWHLWVGTGRIISAIYNKTSGQWFSGPELPRISFSTNEIGESADIDDASRSALHETVRTILTSKEFGLKPKSLGIAVHLADEIRIRDLDPEFARDTDFDNLNELLISAPDIALGDDSVSPTEGKWRLLPLLGVVDGDKNSLAVQVSSRYVPIIEAFREYGELRNLPVTVEVYSAALEAVSGIPRMLPEGTSTADTLFLLQFDAFTLLCATGSRAEIIMVRPLIHRAGDTLSPMEVSEFLAKTGALLNMKSPKVVFVSLTNATTDKLKEELAVYLEFNPNCEHSCIAVRDLDLTAEAPERRFELAFSTADLSFDPAKATPLERLRQKWAIQDFYGKSLDEISRMPTRNDLRLLKFAGHAKKAVVVALLAFAGWTATDFVTRMRSEAWKLPPTSANEMQLRLAQLQKERREWEHWDNLLTKRSEGWLAMEALLTLFPEGGGVVLHTAGYRAQTQDEDSQNRTVGVNREWTISGYANPEVASNLPTLGSRTRAAELLNQIAEENHADYLRVGGDTRSLTVSLQQKQGTMPPSFAFPARVARHYRTAFDLRISQTLDAKDELALSTSALKHE